MKREKLQARAFRQFCVFLSALYAVTIGAASTCWTRQKEIWPEVLTVVLIIVYNIGYPIVTFVLVRKEAKNKVKRGEKMGAFLAE